MPYVIVRGTIEPPFTVFVTGLKPSDLKTLLSRYDSTGEASPSDSSIVLGNYHPSIILSALEVFGYKVVACTTVSKVAPTEDQIVWTLHKEFAIPEPLETTFFRCSST